MDHQRNPYQRIREVLLTQSKHQLQQQSSEEKRNAEIKNHLLFDEFSAKKNKRQQKKVNVPPISIQQESFVVEASLISSLPRFGDKKQDSTNTHLIVNKQRQLLQKYKAKAKNKARVYKSPIVNNIQMNLKGLVDKIGTLTRKIQLIENKSSQNLKRSLTFHNNFLRNPENKRRNFESYQQIQEKQKPRVNSQYDKLRQITRPDFLRTHRRMDTGSHQRNTMIKSMLNRQKSQQIFNRSDLNKVLNQQKQRKKSNIEARMSQTNFQSLSIRNMTHKDQQNSEQHEQ